MQSEYPGLVLPAGTWHGEMRLDGKLEDTFTFVILS
jgi:hypothetical protein